VFAQFIPDSSARTREVVSGNARNDVQALTKKKRAPLLSGARFFMEGRDAPDPMIYFSSPDLPGSGIRNATTKEIAHITVTYQ
jgi:hypothetical protein